MKDCRAAQEDVGGGSSEFPMEEDTEPEDDPPAALVKKREHTAGECALETRRRQRSLAKASDEHEGNTLSQQSES
eukprot:2563352-Rhodomonas_salina.1